MSFKCPTCVGIREKREVGVYVPSACLAILLRRVYLIQRVIRYVNALLDWYYPLSVLTEIRVGWVWVRSPFLLGKENWKGENPTLRL